MTHFIIPPSDPLILPASILDALATDRMPHAALLVGTNRATNLAARYIAQVLLCEGESRPCGQCSACIKFHADVQTDFLEVGGQAIKTSEIEAMQRWLPVRAHSGKKVYTLYGADHMTGVAANRILKTLEEPQRGVFALLTALGRQAVLSTIRSRCTIYTITESGAAPHTDPQVVPLLEEATQGAENHSFDGFVEKMIKWTQMWLVDKCPALILAAQWQSYCEEVSPADSLTLLVEYLRDILHTRVGQSSIRFQDWEASIKRIAPILEVKQWTRAIEIVLDSRQRLESHVATLLNFEQMCIRLREVLPDV
ncbi:hypothetical protein NZD89_01330 [Alicyclobacillus fastidiosus]|uniref:DNA polymerase III subunit delta n=1 Tax=Alicyclobacillus fastidiosus TaxID=392011 RepID=A0ABY6ZH06_9BACL|nr:hypothetical protein [Alicyclobacillus fastidiosus]WAH42184.1 hypothetical protein NZD89_01330 [Alicyclobacillus fastidiosus]GMA63975.1 hypothetical protein GCM10025859_44150 [Alicyclobacillus fastidiosus]